MTLREALTEVYILLGRPKRISPLDYWGDDIGEVLLEITRRIIELEKQDGRDEDPDHRRPG
jgi:hypothetical protein